VIGAYYEENKLVFTNQSGNLNFHFPLVFKRLKQIGLLTGDGQGIQFAQRAWVKQWLKDKMLR
jgi:hypothetical protein